MGQVRAVYDFDAQPGSGELTIRVGEMFSVIQENIEGGWIEGQNSKGKRGLFPESYVTKVQITGPLPPTQHFQSSNNPPPAMAPPPLPSSMRSLSGAAGAAGHNYQMPPSSGTSSTQRSRAAANDDPWNTAEPIIAPAYLPPGAPSAKRVISHQSSVGAATSSLPQLHQPSSAYEGDDYDDEWSDEDEEIPEFNPHAPVSQRSQSAGLESVSTAAGGARQPTGGTAKMKTINRFSNFVKSGLESYILATSKMTAQPGESHRIVVAAWIGALKVSNNQIEWECQLPPYTCIVSKPKKESKLKGLKSFIAYSLTCSSTGLQVSRRYKHFDWLYEQLTNKYLLIPIPPLPEKQVSGRYDEDLIEHRKSILQLWISRICRHPVLSQSEVWTHFISCTDEKRWKIGKRQAEKDEYTGGNFFNCVIAPPQQLETGKIEKHVENYARCVKALNENVREMSERIGDSQKRMLGSHKLNWYKMSQSFGLLGNAFDLEQQQTNPSSSMGGALKNAAEVMRNIGDQHEQHGKRDTESLLDFIYTYKGLFDNVPEIVNMHKSTLAKVRDNERLLADGKISTHEAEAIRQRADTISYALLAEINHFNRERDSDFRKAFGTYFSQQAAFYSEIGRQMADLAQTFGHSQEPNA